VFAGVPKRGSFRAKLVLMMLCVSVPLVALLVFQSVYSISLLHDKVAETDKDLLAVYMEKIDQNLAGVEYFMTSLATHDLDLISLESYAEKNENEYQLAKIRLMNVLSQSAPFYSIIDGFFVFCAGRCEFVTAINSSPPFERTEHIYEYIETVQADMKGGEPARWMSAEIDGGQVLMRIEKSGNSCFGAWARVENLLLPLERIDLGKDGKAYFVSETGRTMEGGPSLDLDRAANGYYRDIEGEKHLVVGSRSQRASFALAAVIPDTAILRRLPHLQSFALLLSILSTAVIPLGLLFLKKSVIDPLTRVTEAMTRVGEGDLEMRARPEKSSDEITLLSDTFNGMVAKIRELKIDIYEETLNVQRAELAQLQLQIKPHFYLNCLNVIYHLAEMREYARIQGMTRSLVSYFRYTLRSGESFVSLKTEIENVVNYAQILETRYPGMRKIDIRSPDAAMTAEVPPLLLLTFVENASKYGISEDGSLDLSVFIDIVEGARGKELRCILGDRGPGFSEDMLMKLRGEVPLGDGDQERIGIWNIRRRLSILYYDRAELTFSNADDGRSGAVVSMRLPFVE
jgi:two-component system, sensor histidine kinase YesM